MMGRHNLAILAALISSLVMPVAAQDSGVPQIRADQAASSAQRMSEIEQRNNTSRKSSANTAAVADAKSPFELTTETVTVATWDGGSMTNQQVSETLSMRKPKSIASRGSEPVYALPLDMQRNVVRDLAYEQMILKKARAAGITEKTPKIAASLKNSRDAILAHLYYDREVTPRLLEMSESTAKDYYEQHKAELYTQPAKTMIQYLQVGKYQRVTAREGDTLKSIAKKITGNADAAGKILRGDSPFIPRMPSPEIADEVLTSPLKAGESLLVPLSDDEKATASATAEKIHKLITEGTQPSDAVAETTSTDLPFEISLTPPMIFGGRGYWPQIYKTVDALDMKTTIGQVIETPADFGIVLLLDKHSTQTTPFSEVKNQLISKVKTDDSIRRQTVEELRKETLDKLWTKYKVKLNDEIINHSTLPEENTTDTATSKASAAGEIVASAKDFQFTLPELVADLRLTGKSWQELTPDQRKDLVKSAPEVVRYLVVSDAEALDLDKTPQFQKEMESKAVIEITNAYMQQDSQKRKLTEQDFRDYYTKHLDKYTSPAQVTLREITKRIILTLPPEKKAKAIENASNTLKEIKSRIKSIQDFEQAARSESESIPTRSRGGLIGVVSENFRGPIFQNQIAQLKVGQVSDPFMYGSEVMIIRLDDKTPPTVQPFEDVAKRVIHDFMADQPRKLNNEARDEALKKADFELKF